MMKRPSVLSARVVQELALVFMRSLKLSERVRVFVVLCVCARDRFRTANDLRVLNRERNERESFVDFFVKVAF
jgi:hypothetical protein